MQSRNTENKISLNKMTTQKEHFSSKPQNKSIFLIALQKSKWIIFIEMIIFQGHTDLPSYFLC